MPRYGDPRQKRRPGAAAAANAAAAAARKKAAAQAAAQAEARRKAAAAAAQAAAQKRRAQAEQQARIVQQQARAAQERAEQMQTARKARAQALAQKRTERLKHVVKKTDSPETIATKLGTTAQNIASQAPVGGLKAGQVLEFDVRTIPGAAKLEREASAVTAEQVRGPSGLLTPRAQALKRAADALGGQPGTMFADPIFAEPIEFGAEGAAPAEQGAPVGFDTMPEQPATPFQGDPYGRDFGREPIGMGQRREQEAREAYAWRSQMQYTTDTLRYVYETGDTSALFSGTVPGYEGAVLWLTDDMMDAYYYAYGEQAIDKIIGMGYVRTPDGLWVPTTVEPLGYGMGGYDYGFPSFGVGDYEPKPGQSSYRAGASGVRTRADRQQLFSGSVPRAHWRI